MKRYLSHIVLAAALTGAAHADWRQFRGPAGNGISDADLPAALSGASAIQWAVNLPGRGLSSPIVVGDRIFVTCASGPRQRTLHVICFNAKDGSRRWERTFLATGRTMCHEKTCVAAPTPASDGERVYAIFSSNDLVCLDLEGNLVWLRGLTSDYPNASNSLGMSSSLLVMDGVVIAQVENDSESFTAGIDALTGVNQWKMDRPKMANWTSPVFLRGKGGRPLAGLQSGKGLAAVDPKSGTIVWNYTDGASTIPSSTPFGDRVYIPSHGLTAIAPGEAGAAPQQVWRNGQLGPSTASPVVLGGKVFTLNGAGVLSAGDVDSGKRLWQLRLKGPFSATPVGAGSRLFAVNEKGIGQLVDVNKSEGEVLGEVELGQTVLSTPAAAAGSIYIRSDGKLWKIGKS